MTDPIVDAIVEIGEGSMNIDRALFDTCNALAEEVQKLQVQVSELQSMMHNVIMHESVLERRLDSLLTMFLTHGTTTDE